MKNAENFKMIKINDVYFISKKIRQYNPNYCLFYAQSLAKYVVYDLSKREIVITYDKYPDYGLINKLYITSRQNIDKYLGEIERRNHELELRQINKTISKAQDQICEVFSYAEKKGGETLSQNKIKKIISEE